MRVKLLNQGNGFAWLGAPVGHVIDLEPGNAELLIGRKLAVPVVEKTTGTAAAPTVKPGQHRTGAQPPRGR